MNKILLSGVIVLVITSFFLGVLFKQNSIKCPQLTQNNNSAVSLNIPFNTTDLYKSEWKQGIVYTTQNLAVDLRTVCVQVQDPNTTSSTDECKYTDYWTNNRTGNWEKLQRDTAGTEGSAFCENYEKWKVAKGMPCTRIMGETTDSFVSF